MEEKCCGGRPHPGDGRRRSARRGQRTTTTSDTETAMRPAAGPRTCHRESSAAFCPCAVEMLDKKESGISPSAARTTTARRCRHSLRSICSYLVGLALLLLLQRASPQALRLPQADAVHQPAESAGKKNVISRSGGGGTLRSGNRRKPLRLRTTAGAPRWPPT